MPIITNNEPFHHHHQHHNHHVLPQHHQMTISSIPLNISNNQTFNQQQIFINPQQIQQQRAGHILNQHINYGG
jgi:hypothetical protein